MDSHEDQQLDKSLLGEKEEDEAYNHEPVCLENVPVYAKWMIILNPKTFSQCPEPALVYFVSKVIPVFENDDLQYEWQGHKSDEQRKYKDDWCYLSRPLIIILQGQHLASELLTLCV